MPRQESNRFTSQINQSAQREADDDRILYTDNYGGLNVESSEVSIPLADSPALLNLDISVSGRINKRGGSIIRSTQTGGYSDGYICVPVELLTGEYLMWEKVGTALYGSVVPDKESNSTNVATWTFSNIFSASSTNERPSWVVTKEDAPRIIMVQPSTVPIEVEFFMVELVGDGDTTITYPGDWTSNFGTSRSYAVYGETTNKLSGISHSSGTTTFTFTSSIPSGTRLTLVQPTFHWWAEAIQRTQDQVYSTALQFATSVAADANVEVPVEIRRGLYSDYLSSGIGTQVMPCIILSSHTVAATAFTHDRTPSTASEYAWSSLEYTAGGGEYISFGSSYATFGGIPANTRAMGFLRYTFLPFNGKSYAQGQNIGVYDPNGFQYTWRNTTASRTTSWGEYWLLDASWTTLASTSGTTLAPWIRFDASVPFGAINATVTIVNQEVNTNWVGSTAVATFYSRTTQGSFRPIFGLCDFCNYQTGVFPTIIALYQNRVALSGISAFPNKIYLSNQGSNGSNYNYQNFQIYMEDSTVDYNPVEVEINGIGKITGMVDWFSSLFIFTQDSVKRIYSPNQILTPTSKTQSDIATVGCRSSHSITKTDSNVIFLSDSGLYKIAILEQTSDYYVESVSLKVESFFKKYASLLRSSWVSYDSINSVIYVGVPYYDEYINQRIFAYFTEREAWTEYALYSGYLPNSYGVCFDGRVFINVVDRKSVSVTTQPTASTHNFLTEFNRNDLSVDMLQTLVAANVNAGTQTIVGSTNSSLTFTINSDQRVISLSKDKVSASSANNAFKYIPIDNYYHLDITYTQGAVTTTLTGGEDYINETLRNSIHFTYYPWNTGDTVTVTLKDEDGYQPVWIQDDNIELTEVTDYTVTVASGLYTIQSTSTLSGTLLGGFKFPAYHKTPTFFRQGHRAEKRTTHYIGYYSNRAYGDLFTVDDGTVADQYKIKANANVAIVYNDSRSGSVSSDIYLGSQLIWDVSMFDVAHSPFQFHDNVRIVQPIIGVGYNFSVINFNFSSKKFELIGYAVETVQKGKNSRAWF